LILGSGYTGSRVARLLVARGVCVRTARSSEADLTQAGGLEHFASLVTPGCVVLHSIPSLPGAVDRELVGAFGHRPARVVYLSTTSVYGNTHFVNERTPVCECARVETERAVQAGPWDSLILRPAAIYGPGRGVQVAMAQGRYMLLGDGSNFISRIHVDDLAALVEAALLSPLTGAYPVADQHPCPAREIAEYCSQLLGLPLPLRAELEDVPQSRRANRRVDGSAICRELSVTLRYPSYKEGIPASL
jgi:nucleoside-diphosphate-sugar epimerase